MRFFDQAVTGKMHFSRKGTDLFDKDPPLQMTFFLGLWKYVLKSSKVWAVWAVWAKEVPWELVRDHLPIPKAGRPLWKGIRRRGSQSGICVMHRSSTDRTSETDHVDQQKYRYFKVYWTMLNNIDILCTLCFFVWLVLLPESLEREPLHLLREFWGRSEDMWWPRMILRGLQHQRMGERWHVLVPKKINQKDSHLNTKI